MKLNIIKAKSFYFLLILMSCQISLYAQTASKPPVYVLVHGAFHGGWCWQKVSSELRSKGDVVYTPTLSGLGEHKNILNKDIDLEMHIADIVNLIVMEDLRDVVLVGHSYAGAVIAGVADRIPERLSKLVFLDAMLIENGQSANDRNPKDVQQAFIKAAMDYDKGLSVPNPSSEFFGVTDTADIRWTNQRLTSQPFKTFTQPLILKNPYGNHLPMIYIACTNPELKAIQPFADQTKNNSAWKYTELKTGHDAMITMPHELAEMLQGLK